MQHQHAFLRLGSRDVYESVYISGPVTSLRRGSPDRGKRLPGDPENECSTGALPIATRPCLHPTQAPAHVCPWLAGGIASGRGCCAGLVSVQGERSRSTHALLNIASTRMMIEGLLAEAKAADTQRKPSSLPQPR